MIDLLKLGVTYSNNDWETACREKDRRHERFFKIYDGGYNAEERRLASYLEQARAMGILDAVHEVAANRILPFFRGKADSILAEPYSAALTRGDFGPVTAWNAFVLEPSLDAYGDWIPALKIELYRRRSVHPDVEDGISEIAVIEFIPEDRLSVQGDRAYMFRADHSAAESTLFRNRLSEAIIHPMEASATQLIFHNYATRQVYALSHQTPDHASSQVAITSSGRPRRPSTFNMSGGFFEGELKM